MAHPSECRQKTSGSSTHFFAGKACPRQQVRRIVSTRRRPRLITAPLMDLGGCAIPNRDEPAARKHCAAIVLSYDTRRTTSSTLTLSEEALNNFSNGRKIA